MGLYWGLIMERLPDHAGKKIKHHPQEQHPRHHHQHQHPQQPHQHHHHHHDPHFDTDNQQCRWIVNAGNISKTWTRRWIFGWLCIPQESEFSVQTKNSFKIKLISLLRLISPEVSPTSSWSWWVKSMSMSKNHENWSLENYLHNLHSQFKVT